MTDTTAETTENKSSFITKAIEAPLIALGLSDVTPERSHVFLAALLGLAGGWVLGIMRAKAKPDVNVLGF